MILRISTIVLLDTMVQARYNVYRSKKPNTRLSDKKQKTTKNVKGDKKMSNYNGWTNRETWLVNLYFDDHFTDYNGNIEDFAEYIEDFIRSQVVSSDNFTKDLLAGALEKINFCELAKTWAEDIDNE